MGRCQLHSDIISEYLWFSLTTRPWNISWLSWMQKRSWLYLLQEFNLQIKDKKWVENVVANHLSRLAITHNSHSFPINDDFPKESLMLIEAAPWYAHIANYLVTGEVPSEWKAQDKKHFFAKIHVYYWEEPFRFKYCADQIIRKCIPKQEQQGILSHCHESACGGHFASQKTTMKVDRKSVV